MYNLFFLESRNKNIFLVFYKKTETPLIKCSYFFYLESFYYFQKLKRTNIPGVILLDHTKRLKYRRQKGFLIFIPRTKKVILLYNSQFLDPTQWPARSKARVSSFDQVTGLLESIFFKSKRRRFNQKKTKVIRLQPGFDRVLSGHTGFFL